MLMDGFYHLDFYIIPSETTSVGICLQRNRIYTSFSKTFLIYRKKSGKLSPP